MPRHARRDRSDAERPSAADERRYCAALFDAFAPSYEQQMCDDLQYNVPRALAAALRRAARAAAPRRLSSAGLSSPGLRPPTTTLHHHAEAAAAEVGACASAGAEGAPPLAFSPPLQQHSSPAGQASAGWRALDLGCGTGLCGPALRDWLSVRAAAAVGGGGGGGGGGSGGRRPDSQSWPGELRPLLTLRGLDLSAEMLRRAAAKGCYDLLLRADATAQLVAEAAEGQVSSGLTSPGLSSPGLSSPGRLPQPPEDLIVAADVLGYLGRQGLGRWLRACAARLRPASGLLAFTTEQLELPPPPPSQTAAAVAALGDREVVADDGGGGGGGSQLQRSGRWAFTDSAVLDAAQRSGELALPACLPACLPVRCNRTHAAVF
jgi:predicted TPR repeat methyltransferase